ncbi:hypothetical protein K490DRAFT_4683, partial [Saccharata proteae CBS 121410]
YLYSPQPPITQSPTGDPLDLVILATWFAAANRHIEKYINSYKRLYPAAHILVLTSSMPDMTYLSDKAQRSRLSHAVHQIESCKQSKSKGEEFRCMLHIFSNGGANTACQLAESYTQMDKRLLPLNAMIIDSAPGRPEIKRSLKATTAHLSKKPLLRLLALALILPFVMTSWILGNVFGMENLLDRNRRKLNDRNLFAVEVARCYVYSPTDEMIAASDIEGHADEAEAAGWRVERVKFRSSAHVSHVVEDEEKYWGAVGRCLREG